jgi:hypothetical protein
MYKFYALVTGQEDAFYQMCMVLPDVIQRVVEESDEVQVPNDKVINELREIADSEQVPFAMAIYMLGFGEYSGF